MNAWIDLLRSASDSWLNHGLAMAWQVTLAVAVIALCERGLARRTRAVTRHALWMLVLVKLVLPPDFAVPVSPAYWLGEWASPTAALQKSAVANTVSSDTDLAAVTAFPSEATTHAAAARPALSWGSGLFLVWLTGVAVCTAHLLIQTVRMRRLLRAAADTTPQDPLTTDTLRDAAARLGLRRVPRWVTSETLPGPSVAGLLHPTLILPPALTHSLDRTRLRNVLLHEVAHVKRGDLWINALQTWLQIAYWWHPAVWYANARIRRLREEAADETVVVALAGETEDYAQTLVDVARTLVRRQTFSLGLLGILESPTALRSRIERLLTLSGLRSARLSQAGWRACVLLGLVVLPLASGPGTTSNAQSPRTERAQPGVPDPGSRPVPSIGVRERPDSTPSHLARRIERIRIATDGLTDTTLGNAIQRIDDQLRNVALSGGGTRIRAALRAAAGEATVDPVTGVVTAAHEPPIDLLKSVEIHAGPLPDEIRLSELLEVLVRAASRPIHYTLNEDNIEFRLGPLLVTRLFRIDPRVMVDRLPKLSPNDDPWASLQSRLLGFFATRNITMPRFPAAIFVNERAGTLMVRLPPPEMDRVEEAVNELMTWPAQVQLESKIIEVSEETARTLGLHGLLKRPSRDPDPLVVLSESQSRLIARAMEQRPDSRVLAAPRITTLSARGATVEVSDPGPPGGSPAGPSIQVEVVPFVDADGFTVVLEAWVRRTHLVNGAALAAPDRNETKSEPTPVLAPNVQGYVVQQAHGSARFPDGQTMLMELPAPGPELDPAGKHAGRRTYAFITATQIDPAGNRVFDPDTAPFDPKTVPDPNRIPAGARR